LQTSPITSHRMGREGGVEGGFVVAVEVPLVEQPIVVDDKERRRPARLKVIHYAAVGAAVPDGFDLGGVGVVSERVYYLLSCAGESLLGIFDEIS
jgi:hypothetical protein